LEIIVENDILYIIFIFFFFMKTQIDEKTCNNNGKKIKKKIVISKNNVSLFDKGSYKWKCKNNPMNFDPTCVSLAWVVQKNENCRFFELVKANFIIYLIFMKKVGAIDIRLEVPNIWGNSKRFFFTLIIFSTWMINHLGNKRKIYIPQQLKYEKYLKILVIF
jgi:hypothetical protein